MIELHVDQSSALNLSQQLVQQLRNAIFARRLTPGEQLPSVRELARQTGVNPLTIGKAYAELEGERLIETRWGKGSFVTAAAGKPTTVAAAEHLRTLVDAFIADALPLARTETALIAALRDRLRRPG